MPTRGKQFTSTIRFRIMALTAGVACLTCLITMTIYYRWTVDLALERAKSGLRTQISLVSPQVAGAYQELEQDTRLLARTPPITGIRRAIEAGGIDPESQSSVESWRARLETLFSALLESRSHYRQVRYIGVANGGRELVRVDATHTGEESPTRVTLAEDLQSKGAEFYLRDCLDIPRDGVYFSPVTPNRERGSVPTPDDLALRCIVPVHHGDVLFGFIVINADAMETLNKKLKPLGGLISGDTYLVSDSPTWLTHSPKSGWRQWKTTGTFSSQRSIMETIRMLHKNPKLPDGSEIDDESGSYAIEYKALQIPSHPSSRKLGIAIAVNRSALIAPVRQIRSKGLWISLGLTLLFTAFAAFAAHRLATPLNRMSSSIQDYHRNRRELRLPERRPDEVGALARAFSDLTRELSASESATHSAMARLQSILDQTAEGLFTFDRHGRIQQFNGACERLFGHTPHSVIGAPIAQFIPRLAPDSNENSLLEILSQRSSQTLENLETIAIRSDGTTFPLEISISQIYLDSEYIYCGVARDISELKRNREQIRLYTGELVEARDLARAASESKSEFLANMSHEIRTPMTSILGYTDLLQTEAVDAEEKDSYLRTIQRNGQHLLTIINDILDLSKIEAGKMTIEKIACNPHRIIREVSDLLAERAERKEIELISTVSGTIPATIQTDPTRLRQVLMNLVGNAIKFTSDGSVTLELAYDPEHPERISFHVRDTGIGLSANQVATLFQPFSQADATTTRRFGGTGLGLTISQRLVEMLGGTISVESVLGEGSTFTAGIATGSLDGVEFLDPNSEEEAPAPLDTESKAVTLEGLRILVAEDGADNQRLIRFILTKAQAEVTLVENGELAVRAALAAKSNGHPFDVILMDMQMPVMDGYTATRMLRENDYSSPIIALTAHAMTQEEDKCRQSGTDAFETKPIDRERLIRRVHAFGVRSNETTGA